MLLRGLEKVRGEWTVVCLGYNLRRLHGLGAGAKASGDRLQAGRAGWKAGSFESRPRPIPPSRISPFPRGLSLQNS